MHGLVKPLLLSDNQEHGLNEGLHIITLCSLLERRQPKRKIISTNPIECGLSDGTYDPHASMRHVRYRTADVRREAHVVPTKQCIFFV